MNFKYLLLIHPCSDPMNHWTCLSLRSNNNIGPKGATNFSLALKSLTALRSLDLRYLEGWRLEDGGFVDCVGGWEADSELEGEVQERSSVLRTVIQQALFFIP